jgi:hypothetical protein
MTADGRRVEAVEIVGAPTKIEPVAQAFRPAGFHGAGTVAFEEDILTPEGVSYSASYRVVA